MTVYNKLKIAILAVIASQNIQAISIDPVQVQSAPGELLYAEIHFRHSNTSVPLNASLATAEDLLSMGTGHQPPGHLNFFTRRDGAGNGVITITSSRPVTDAELNFIVNIKEGNASRLQQIRTPLKRNPAPSNATQTRANERALTPVVIVNEKEIALNLPVSTLYTAKAPVAAEQPLLLSTKAPPQLATSTPVAIEPVTHVQNYSVTPAEQHSGSTSSGSETSISKVTKTNSTGSVSSEMQATQTATASTARSQDPLAQKFAAEQAAQKRENPTTTTQTASTPKPTSTAAASTATPAAKYVVRSNESLWGIASRIATEQNRPVSEVMQQIKNSNEHAFIQGDVNRLRRGAALNLHGMQQAKQPVKVSAAELAKVPSKQSGKTKYRLNQAEMSLVAEKAQDSAQSSANSAAEKNKTSKELSLKVMTSREKTVKLQRNVTQLELALNQKDHRIQLLNARLAQLQQQLKAQQADKRSQ
ncbi:MULTISPECIES: hypothetical protein [unclassified Acinetobacter]|uniref:FimV/HubP-related protein n=1 Tax=unclassified Acinetobacter TaxID=196816 RepID=UPI0015D1AFAA|nr:MULTISPECIES: hypothetical protein [unclassified Acinetobacter]UUS64843.1 hypothetical protein MST18_13525 [Acinetobacter sp. YH12068_T]